jgi:hypothetical protein
MTVIHVLQYYCRPLRPQGLGLLRISDGLPSATGSVETQPRAQNPQPVE